MKRSPARPGGKTDVLTAKQRSYNMSRIRGKDTKPELLLRKALWAKGLRYRVKNKLPGRPDIVFPGKKVVVFVDGCFWHGCPEHLIMPKSNSTFWKDKIQGNIKRDARVTAALEKDGWTVLRFWEHEMKDTAETVVDKVLQACLSCPLIYQPPCR